MKKTSMKCEICKEAVSELGAYAKIAMARHAHLSCYTKHCVEAAFQAGKKALLEEQRAAREEQQAREQRERLDREARERAEAERRQEVAERERTNRIIAQQANPLPPKLEPAKKPEAKPEEKHDRFELVEIE